MSAHTFGRIRYASALDGAPALIDRATDLLARVSRVAVHASPASRLRLRGELALVERVIEIVEDEVSRAAQATLLAVRPRRVLPAPRRALPTGAGR